MGTFERNKIKEVTTPPGVSGMSDTRSDSRSDTPPKSSKPKVPQAPRAVEPLGRRSCQATTNLKHILSCSHHVVITLSSCCHHVVTVCAEIHVGKSGCH